MSPMPKRAEAHMHCSWCEMQLERYVERSLSPRGMYTVAKHLRGCRACRELLREARMVDALLDTMHVEDSLAINFTFAVMAEVRTITPVRPSKAKPWLWTLAFIGTFWLIFGVWFATIGAHDARALSTVHTFVTALASAGNTVLAPIHSLTQIAPFALAGGIAILLLDGALLVALLLFYRYVRPRLRARLSEG